MDSIATGLAIFIGCSEWARFHLDRIKEIPKTTRHLLAQAITNGVHCCLADNMNAISKFSAYLLCNISEGGLRGVAMNNSD